MASGLLWSGLLGPSVSDAAPFVPARHAQCVAVSADGSLVATGISGLSNEEFPPGPHPSPRKCGVVQVWSAESGQRLCRFETFGDLTHVALSTDGRLVAASRWFTTGEGLELNEVRVWDIAARQMRFVWDRCHAFTFAPQGSAIAVASRRRCVVYDATTGEKLKQFPALAGAMSLEYSPQGDRLLGVVVTPQGCVIRSCRVADAEDVRDSPPVAAPFYRVAQLADGSQLATGHADGSVLLWDAAALRPVSQFPASGRGIQHPFFSPDGTLLAVADQTTGDVAFWHLSSGEQVARYTFEKGGLHTFRLRSELEPLAPERDPVRFVFLSDSQSFLSGPHGGIVRSVSNGQDTQRFGD